VFAFDHLTHVGRSDFALLVAVSRGFARGAAPYDILGPGKLIEYPHEMAYPLTAIIALIPFALLPLTAGRALFVGLSTLLWAWALLKRPCYWPALVGGLSLAALFVIGEGQWSPLLMAAALIPALGWLLAIKPTIGLALFIGFPSWRTALGVCACVAIATLMRPAWPFEWLRAIRTVQQEVAIVTRPGGILVLLALLRWREPSARLLVALSCIPHTTLPYETLYLFLIPQTAGRAWSLCVLSYLAPLLVGAVNPMTLEYVQRYATAILWTAYVPCTVMVLFPPRIGGAASLPPSQL
jgi:hypothetical protein